MDTHDASSLSARLVKVLEHPVVRLALPLVVLCLAGYVLTRLASEVRWSDVKADIAASSWSTLGLAAFWTAASYVGLASYDILAVRSVARKRIPDWVAGFAGSSGYAISNLLGFSYLTGTAVRYRIYSSLGLELNHVAGIIAISWVGLWLGLTLILSILLTLHPQGLSTVVPLNPTTETVIGVALAVALAGLFLWLSRGTRRVSVADFGFDLPGVKLGGGLMMAGVIDLCGSALTLYVLMPSDLVQSPTFFFVIYVGAIALGILSHSPGGLGVFEAAMIAGLGAAGRPDVLAALLLYRVVYTILPFVVAIVCLAVVWAIAEHRTVTQSASWVFRIARPVVPFAAASISLLAGSVLLFSGNIPVDSDRLGVLLDVLPLSVIEASHMIGSVVGLLLIVISRGLFRKLYRAWLIAILLMTVGFVVSLTKGLDWEESLGLLAAIGLLALFRSAFYRVEGASVFRLNGTWILSLAALVLAITWVGFVAYSHVEYRDELWWDFALHADASRFLRASLVVAILLAGISLDSIVLNRGTRSGPEPIPDVVRKLVAESEDTEANMALIGDKSFLIAEDGSAFLAYADTGKSLITKGEPVGDEEAGRDLIWQLREKADRESKRCAFYAVSPRYLPTFLDLGLSILKIGEVARVDLTGFTLDGSAKKGFRQARNRASREGYVFEIIPKQELKEYLPELKAISDKWLATKQGEEKSFALGGFDEGYVSNFDHAVLRDPEGRIVAFANLFQGGNKHELSLDLMRYDPDAPSFVMDALFAELMLWGAQTGFRWFSLGAAPFSGIENRQLASFWNRVGGFVYDHGEQFYHFEGLRSFKQKFDPVWTPNYLASPGGLAAPKILYEVNVLISGGIRGLMK
ncbi:bifunctional lysylphosphatidylglycerol flippase/synthetase MprF [Ruegeria sediminis]|uniref:Bifunctional lysylphosphatidylglycerol flippase/synthetase MprF n=1 Tax=Ruegeria sediminis TaxID=2583820 RepID=A0ABY2X0G8_9RHOB|nr:bifunctional lysylphosphatidylglycerol flippase/synthetase MprF [Ruegeria sediminis]TMV08457.1 bifunctional lysylphosphatidylglycerol flippase/synthetase MprF [Ruegeria sediminis]